MRRPAADLLAVAGLAVAAGVACAAGADAGAARFVLAPLLLLVLPGYAVVVALFAPRRVGPELAVLVLALSAAVAIVAGLVLDATPWGLRPGSWAAALVAVVLACCAVAERRRRRSGAPALVVRAPRLPRLRSAALVMLAAAIAAAAFVLATRPLPDSTAAGYTQLWLLPGRGAARVLDLGFASSERRSRSYRLDLRVDGRLAHRWRALRLAPGQTWQTTVVAPGHPAQVDAELYRAGAPGRPYRRVRVEP